jgi:argininosuccinate synthase
VSEKVVLAYSGGLDTSALIPWLDEKYDYDVIACLVDLGRVKDVPAIIARAEAAGAIGAEAIDAKEVRVETAHEHGAAASLASPDGGGRR